MQLQVECNHYSLNRQPCWICEQPFEMKQARVIVCNEDGDSYGEVCPHCIGKGFTWLEKQYHQLTHTKEFVF